MIKKLDTHILKSLPRLHQRFLDLGISSALFSVVPFQSMYTQYIDPAISMSIFDLFFLKGSGFLIEIMVFQLKRHEAHLLPLNLEDALTFLIRPLVETIDLLTLTG